MDSDGLSEVQRDDGKEGELHGESFNHTQSK